MLTLTQSKLRELLEQLEEANRHYDQTKAEDRRLAMITDVINEVMEKIKTHRFTNEKEEADYFRNILPELLSLYPLYCWKIKWDQVVRTNTFKRINQLKGRYEARLKKFQSNHQRFCEYIRDGRNDLDSYYFLRNSPANTLRKYHAGIIVDPGSAPVYSAILASHYANLKLQDEMLSDQFKSEQNPVTGPIFRWSGKQIELIELAYGLFYMGSIEEAKTLKFILDGFQKIFGVRFSQPYRQFQDVITRKKPNQVYMERMVEKFRDQMDEML